MSHPDNHIDELFRRAAENYQLNTRNGNWEDIATRLSSQEKQVHRSRWPIIPLLLFFLLGTLFGTKVFEPAKVKTMQSHRNDDSENKVQRQELVQTYEDKNKTSKTGVKQNRHAISYLKRTNGNHNKAIQNSSKFSLSDKAPGITDILQKDFLGSVGSLNEKENLSIQNLNSAFGYSIIRKPDISIPITWFSDSVSNWAFRNNHVNKSVKVNFKKRVPIYLDFILGLSFTGIKNQKLTKPGVEAGLRTGIRLAKNSSFETGVIFSKKYYYSDGKYFNMENNDPSMPGGMQVLNLTGSSAIFQVPFKFRYDFKRDQSKQFFATAGFTSFFLTKEKNNYLILVNGTKQQLTVTYPKGNRYFAASADLSAGYQFKIHKSKSLRIEPYIQIPLKGIGVGKMPLTGAGIQVAYSIF